MGWGESTGNKVLALQAGTPELHSQNSRFKTVKCDHTTLILAWEKGRQAESWNSLANQISLFVELQVSKSPHL